MIARRDEGVNNRFAVRLESEPRRPLHCSRIREYTAVCAVHSTSFLLPSSKRGGTLSFLKSAPTTSRNRDTALGREKSLRFRADIPSGFGEEVKCCRKRVGTVPFSVYKPWPLVPISLQPDGDGVSKFVPYSKARPLTDSVL